MALKARVTSVNALPSGLELAVDVEYFDDAAPTVILYRHAFQFAIALTINQMRTQIETLGGRVRSARDDRATKAAQFVGAVIDIP
jgi:hypothetical protein